MKIRTISFCLKKKPTFRCILDFKIIIDMFILYSQIWVEKTRTKYWVFLLQTATGSHYIFCINRWTYLSFCFLMWMWPNNKYPHDWPWLLCNSNTPLQLQPGASSPLSLPLVLLFLFLSLTNQLYFRSNCLRGFALVSSIRVLWRKRTNKI